MMSDAAPLFYQLKPHQARAVSEAGAKLAQYGYTYVFGAPRIGKSLIALETATRAGAQSIIVLTKKQAIKDWQKYSQSYNFVVTNYEKLPKLNRDDFDFVIIDEAHNFGAIPKPSQRTLHARAFCQNKPLIFLSGTPVAESPLHIYPQLSLSSRSPFLYFKNFYQFFAKYGIKHLEYLRGAFREKYDRCHADAIMRAVDGAIVRVDYADAGFEYQNFDKPVFIESPHDLQNICKKIKIEKFVGAYPLENESAQFAALLRVTGGFYKDVKLPQPKLAKVREIIAQNAGARVVIMAHFIEEQEALAKIFPAARVLSSTRFCEGVDLSDCDLFILYSFAYSGAKFIQLRDRIVNIEKSRKTHVIIPLLKNGADHAVYRAVSQKRTFNQKAMQNYLNELS